MGGELKLAPLGSAPESLQTCARWLHEEWGPELGFALEDTLDWLREIGSDGSDERGLMAFCDDRLAGIALLVARDPKTSPELTPWLSSLFVAPAFRGRSIGRRLVDAIAEIGRDLGHARLYLYSDTTEDYYRGLGWSLETHFAQSGRRFALMSRSL